MRLVGPELEVWAEMPPNTNVVIGGKGRFMLDVGVNQGEVIGEPPQPSVDAAFAHLREILSLVPAAEFAPFRPKGLPGHHEWLIEEKERVAAMYAALKIEGGKKFHHVNQMTEAAAAHLGVSGDFNPMGRDGHFLRNVLENVGPYYAAQVHRAQGCGEGHLSIWRHYADRRRFPQWDRWLPTRAAYVRYFESVPRLVGRKNGKFIPLPGGMQKIHNPLDHGFSWWLARPKPLRVKRWYLEIRFLPSMGVDLFEWHAHTIVEAVEILLDWFHGANGSRPVMVREQANPAVALLNEFNSDYFPPHILGETEWSRNFAL